VRLVFLGTAEFSLPSLRAIVAAGHDVAAVVTQPDRLGDRGRPAPRPVAEVAIELGLAILQPARLRGPEAVAQVLELRPDALVVAAYGQILPASLLDAPAHGGINVHASLLPRWRGASPIAAAIRAGDDVTGVSIMRMEAGLDTGPVFATRSTPITPDDTTPVLAERLARIGAELLVEVLAEIEAGTALPPQPQNDTEATLAPRLTRADGELDWETAPLEIDRSLRALQPWPGTSVPLGGERVRLLRGEPAIAAARPPAEPGTVLGITGGSVLVACRGGAYRVDEVQAPGRKPMDAAAYLRGRRVAP
jgi:methionyl-tRNA formyltransferase